MQTVAYKKYIVVFFITAGIFAVAFLLSDFIFKKRTQDVKSLEDQIALNFLSSEVQFGLLSEFPCEATTTPFLAEELSDLSSRLTAMEEERGPANPEVQFLKKRYSLLEIKDYLFGKELAKRCGTRQSFILYFYSNRGDCENCDAMGYVLTDIQNDHPDLKIYSFDYNLDISGVRSLIKIYDIKNDLPTLIIGKQIYYGFQNKEILEKLLGFLPTKKPAK